MNIQFKDLNTGEIAYERDLLPSQEEFWNAQERYILFSGGYGCGKSMILIMRCIYDAMRQPNNYILMGRKTYAEIKDVLIKDFREICHPSWIVRASWSQEPKVTLRCFEEGKTSEIIFRNLDKESMNEIAGLNLGGYGIDQAEHIPEGIIMALKGRLRRENIEHRGYMTANPALSYLYRMFVTEKEEGYRLIEASTMENKKNLPADYIKDLESYPAALYKQYVLGKWDDSLFAENGVFAPEHLEMLSKHLKQPSQTREGLQIYKKYIKDHRYQIGIDVAEGAETIDERYRNTRKDNAVITIVDMTAEEEVAKWAVRLTPAATADKAILFAGWYGNPMMIPEMNSMGIALVNRLQDQGYNNIYRRYENDSVTRRRLKKLGFRTTAASKATLISRFNIRLRHGDVKVYSRDTYAEMKTFVYSDIAGKKGAGAQEGYHDDKIMSLLLAFWEDKDPVKGFVKGEARDTITDDMVVPSANISADGKYKPDDNFLKKVAHEENVAIFHTL